MLTDGSYEVFPWWQVYPTSNPYAPSTGAPSTGGTGNVSVVWPSAPTECSGDLHVFICQRCGVCKCGKAKLTAS